MAAEALTAEVRKEVSKRSTKALRREDKVPCVLYGKGRTPIPIAVSERQMRKVVKAHGPSGLVKLTVANGKSSETQLAVYRGLQANALTHRIQHVDFQVIRADEEIRVRVPIHLTGTPVGVDVHAGVLVQYANDLAINCLPDKIPESVEIDVSPLDLHGSFSVKDLTLPEGVTADDDAEKVLAGVVAGSRAAALASEEVESEGEGGEAGETAASGAEAAPSASRD